ERSARMHESAWTDDNEKALRFPCSGNSGSHVQHTTCCVIRQMIMRGGGGEQVFELLLRAGRVHMIGRGTKDAKRGSRRGPTHPFEYGGSNQWLLRGGRRWA